MRKPLSFDRHGDVITEDELPDDVQRELAEFRTAVRKDPRFSRLLAVSLPRAKKLLVFVSLAFAFAAGCATDPDLHSLISCVVPDAINGGPSPEMQCEAACDGVTFHEKSLAPLCTSAAFAAASGGTGQCHGITNPIDGTVGCCEVISSSSDKRLSNELGFEFFQCEAQ